MKSAHTLGLMKKTNQPKVLYNLQLDRNFIT